jgi:hypothetical protein
MNRFSTAMIAFASNALAVNIRSFAHTNLAVAQAPIDTQEEFFMPVEAKNF